MTALHTPTLAHNAVCVLHPVPEVGGPWGRGPCLLPDPCRCSAGAAGQGQAGCVPGTGVVLCFPLVFLLPSCAHHDHLHWSQPLGGDAAVAVGDDDGDDAQVREVVQAVAAAAAVPDVSSFGTCMLACLFSNVDTPCGHTSPESVCVRAIFCGGTRRSVRAAAWSTVVPVL